MISEVINHASGPAALQMKMRIDNKDLWDETFKKLAYRPVAYTNGSLDYHLAYQIGHGGDWQDLSAIIYWNDKPVALWPHGISLKNGVARLTSQGRPVLPPLFVAECVSISRKKIIKLCINLANEIAIAHKIKCWESEESFDNTIGLSQWHMHSMNLESRCHMIHELYIDLKPDISEIKKYFGKNVKSRIAQGSRIWTVGILDSCGEEWQEFQALHKKVSGRVTRSKETWDLQREDIEQQRAFLVWLRNETGEMVGGGLFNFTGDEGVYAVAAYDRKLFDRPLGHVVQYRAIEELKKRGVKWYKIGSRPYATDSPTPTDKEISIGEFKQSFASHVFPCYLLNHRIINERAM